VLTLPLLLFRELKLPFDPIISLSGLTSFIVYHLLSYSLVNKH
jgi:hypothetical protein